MLPDSITQLIAALAKLPGVGPRSAERIALHLVQTDSAVVKQLADAILLAREKIQFCAICGALTEKSPCPICEDSRRDSSLVCVVERAVDILSVEKSGAFRGKFHVLGGKISPLDGVEPEDLRIADLEKRLTHEPIKEIIIALGTDVEGDATSAAIAAASIVAKVTRDRYMRHADEKHPGWGFAEHVGYSTPSHREAILQNGVSPLHRMSFQSLAYQQLAL